MAFSAILLVFENSYVFVLQVCKFIDLLVHISIDCPYFYGLPVKISDLLHLQNIDRSFTTKDPPILLIALLL